MNVPLFPIRPGQTPAAAGLAKAVADHACVCVTGRVDAGTTALLNEAEHELSSRSVRCVRVYGPASGGLTLRDLIAQVVGRPDAATLTDGDLKAGFVALTEPGEHYELVALLVAEAHSLLPSATRYIQLACRSSPRLRVVLAGQASLTATLAQDEFADFRRMTHVLDLHDAAEERPPGSGLAAPSVPRRSGSSALVRLGLAALLVPMVGLIWWRHLPASSAVDSPVVNTPVVNAPVFDVPVGVPGPNAPVAQSTEASAAKEQEPADEIFPPELEADAAPDPPPAVAAVDVPPPLTADTPVEPAPAAPSATSEVLVPEPATEPTVPVESGVTASDAPPATAVPERAAEPTQASVEPAEPPEPAQEANPVATQALEPAVQAPSAVPPPEAVSPPVPSLPKPSRPAVPALPPIQHARTETPRPIVTAAVPPTRLVDERRCRDIVLKAQLGKDLSDADKQFLRSGCRAE